MIFSASSLDLWLNQCKRKWGFRYIDRIEVPPNPSAERGVTAHTSLAGYLNGSPADLPAWLRVGLPHLPAPNTPGMTVEGEFTFELRGHRFIGYKDAELLDRDPPLVIDHKTTRNFRYAKKPDDLRNDIQASLYAADAMVRAKAPAADLLWLYYRADPDAQPEARPITVRLTRADVEPVLERCVAAADDITQLLSLGVTSRDLPANGAIPDPDTGRTMCEAFGGCPFKDVCNPTIEERLFGMDESQKAIIERLALKSKGVNPPAPPAPPAAAAPPPPPPPPPPVKTAAPPPPPPPPPPTFLGYKAECDEQGFRAVVAPPPPPPAVCPPPDAPGPLVGGTVWPAGPAEAPLTKSEYLTMAIAFEECAKFLRSKAAR